ncbi:MAG TPA: serine/threonine-protein kinase [Gemmatimonadales bacterium]|nr:serine/threonine-protein kinase [Gemmatimonadales bacterium]
MGTSAISTCPSCGKPLQTGARFCMECGAATGAGPGGATVAASANTQVGMMAGALGEAERQRHLQQLLMDATVGEFEILGELGRGGMATVYLAHDIALDRKVAVKVIAPALLTTPGSAERFKREARTSAALSHPHIIPIHAVRETSQLLFFVMKCVEGRSLDDIIRKRGPLPIRMVQAILIEVGQALAYAHRRGIVHRDIKPANIMLDGDGWAMVTDFGIAKVLDSDALTVSGTMIGTPFYMSPEQCAGKPVSGASDQYSLGVVAYEMLTGHPPFSGETIMEIMKGHFFEAPRPVEEERPDCPPGLAIMVNRMLAKEPADRWATMDEALAAMNAPPITADDPVRSEMSALARSSAAMKLLSRLSVPVSPVPSGWTPRWRSARAETDDIEEGPRRSGWKTAVAVVGGLAVLAGGGTAAAVYFRHAASQAVPTPAPPPATPAPAVVPPPTDSGTAAKLDTTAKPAPDTSAKAPTAVVQAPPSKPAPDPRLAQDRDDYASSVEGVLNDDWKTLDSGGPDVGEDDRTRFTVTVKPNGSLDDIKALDPNSPMKGPALGCLIRAEFPPLPSSLAKAGSLKARITFNKHGVAVVPL